MHHQSQSRSRLFKKPSVSSSWLGTFLPPFAKCQHSANQDHLACARNIGMIRLLGGKQRLVCASNCAHCSRSSSQPSAAILESWTDHTACQTHRRPQTTFHDVVSPQTCAQISKDSKERIGGQMCGTLAVRCWQTIRSENDDQNHPIPCGSW